DPRARRGQEPPPQWVSRAAFFPFNKSSGPRIVVNRNPGAGRNMMPKQERDEWLMAQVALGKRDYLEPLIRRYASPLLTFIQQMVHDRHRSEELFQEVFLAVWVKRRQYQFPRTFKSWLYAIAVNKCPAPFRAPSLPASLSPP